jgi:hypothetical protein
MVATDDAFEHWWADFVRYGFRLDEKQIARRAWVASWYTVLLPDTIRTDGERLALAVLKAYHRRLR